MIFKKYRSLLLYLASSFIMLGIDSITARTIMLVSNHHVNIVIANTVGCVIGFIAGYLLHTRWAFGMKYTGLKFLIYFVTFILSVILGNFLINVSYNLIIAYMPEWFAFWASKAISVILPFFFWYYVRKKLFEWADKYDMRRNSDDSFDRGRQDI